MEKFKLRAGHIRKLLNDQNFRCFVSGIPLTYENVEIEHIIPLSKGGKHELVNLCFIDKSLKELKRFKTKEEIIELCKIIIENELQLSNH
ncbi:HNH endonuclease [Leptospira sp. 2 VSF19]|uniref:HNH endonuclease n=1 Tax=Leptospira soteropolitanensis TaxID=2950025 RepID=A0ABT3MFL6_9LEPT|nr:HNH endonuclease signature motif containing protein [Leptospira soteropolitanensis]MCW7491997.1 HNH endonuclease [Leptospira soteropolitanensis]MCW7525684.1 HNH endonuclease [Leptospira soteropolitanensis]